MANNNLKIFEHPEFGTIHALQIGGEPWFIGEDITQMLGYRDTFDALKKHIDENDKLNCLTEKLGKNRSVIVINESGLYSLLHFSKRPDVKKIESWLRNDVLSGLSVAPSLEQSAY